MEYEKTCYNCKYKVRADDKLRCMKGDYWKRIHHAKTPCKKWEKEGEKK